VPSAEDALGRAALAAIDHLRNALEDPLSRPVGRILDPPKEDNE
jgi:hypothetical protein